MQNKRLTLSFTYVVLPFLQQLDWKIFSLFSAGKIIFLLLFCIGFLPAYAQEDNPDKLDRFIQFPTKVFQRIDHQASKMEERLTRQTEKYLAQLQKQEQRMKRKLLRKDSAAAHKIFSGSEDVYSQMKNHFGDSLVQLSKYDKYYSGHMDSLQTVLNLVNRQELKIPNSASISSSIGVASNSLKSLQNKFNQADAIRKMVEQRKQFLHQQLQSFGITKAYKKYRKQAYYYQKQVEDYRNLLNDPEALGKRVVAEAKKLPVFQEFFRKYSELGMLFPAPDNYGSVQSLSGLQTINQVQQLIQGQIASGGPNAQAIVQQNIQQAQGLLDQLKDKVSKLGDSGGDIDMPDFKPNTQGTKTFLQRLEYGTTIQTQHASYYFPTTTDMALTVGYRFSDKLILGVGASYKMGWGRDFRHIAVSSQGIGFRSFGEWKIKGSFFASGGFEYNYQEPFDGIQQIGHLDDWTKSGLIGISKIISVKSKLFKKTKVQLLWDFLSYYQQPATNPIKFRIGYNF